MSDYSVIFIPTDHRCVPPVAAHEEARLHVERRLPGIVGTVQVSISVSEHPEIVHGFANFENVVCPYCWDFLTDWWGDEALPVAERSNFENLSVVLPCCERHASLNELHYYFPLGFARFQLEALNPNVGPKLPQGLLRELEAILGCRLRVVRQHI